MNQRFIGREIIAEFAHDGLLYESAEKNHNLVFVGFDERGAPRHAHKRGLYSEGKPYKGNASGSAPAYSFHRNGPSERLFVFEAPVDLLSFVTLNPQNWRQHSSVALCGVSEHAMLKQLELNPQLRSVTLCLDHDEAGIEATGRLTELLRERGYSDINVLRSQFKDWNEDLKAIHNLEPLPAEEHPQLAVSAEVFRSIAIQCEWLPKSVRVESMLPVLLQRFKASPSAELAEDIAALALSAVVREYRQLGKATTPADLAEQLSSSFAPHHNRGSQRTIADNMIQLVQTALQLTAAPGVRSAARKAEQADAWLNAATASAMFAIKVRAEELSEELRQTENRAVMQL
jgi:DNA primase